MKKLNVGDRVACYHTSRMLGTIVRIGDFNADVILDKTNKLEICVHIKQLRKLKPKKEKGPTEIWVNIYKHNHLSVHPSKQHSQLMLGENAIEGGIRFVRAKDQK